MKYLAKKNYRALVLTAQSGDDGIDISIISRPFHLITTDLELIIDYFNTLIENESGTACTSDAKESVFQRISTQLIQILEMVIDDRIAVDDFHDQLTGILPHLAAELGRVFTSLQQLHELFLQQGKCFNEITSDMVIKAGGRERYLAVIKTVLIAHVRRIVEILRDEQQWTYLRNPLYLQAKRDVRRLLPGLKRGAKRRRAAIAVNASAESAEDATVAVARLR